VTENITKGRGDLYNARFAVGRFIRLSSEQFKIASTGRTRLKPGTGQRNAIHVEFIDREWPCEIGIKECVISDLLCLSDLC